ncbi:class I SAM-dependent methyltransferase [Actinocorallia populi]|uniref:class I SAM-dependent methyltransferase n=1 Tax=Actinocorallia populi TaxID=2079200 RepID=UPI000D0903C6|nr:class I SAM-dependent methyltransferase [Actinocorallia populi]
MAHLTEMLDLDAEVLHEYHREVISWVGSLTPGRPHVVDIGAGTGTGSLALAGQLPDARITAVDVDETLLEHLRSRAAERGVADRIRTVRADLDHAWPELDPADLVWASASMHHMADPGQIVARVRETLRPGGLFAITELDSFPRFLPDPAGAALEERCHAALAAHRAEAGLHMHEDWGTLLAKTGFTVEAERHFDIDLRPPLPPAAARYAQISLQRARHGLAGALSPEDLAALDEITAAIPERTDLTVRAARSVWLARRPV